MTITTAPRVESLITLGGRRAKRSAGFTLVEVMVSAAISAFVLAAIFSAFLFFCRTGMRMSHYSDMERQSRSTLQRFGQDARQAQAVTWVDANTLRLTVDGAAVTYGYNSNTKKFSRTQADGTVTVLATGVLAFRFSAYDIAGNLVSFSPSLSAAATSTKMVQVDIDLGRNTTSLVNASAQILSARYVLRNKGVG